jgi:putative holliday junction resolvase
MIKVLGIDYGSKSIGVAIGYHDFTTPLKTFENVTTKNYLNIVEEIAEIVKSESISIIVVGVPDYFKNKEIPANIRKLAEDLKDRVVDVNVEYIDERLTTKEAIKTAVEGGISMKKRKEDHSLSACMIIHRYFENID